MNAIETAGQNAGNSGLSGASLTGKDIAMRDAFAFDGIERVF